MKTIKMKPVGNRNIDVWIMVIGFIETVNQQ